MEITVVFEIIETLLIIHGIVVLFEIILKNKKYLQLFTFVELKGEKLFGIN